MGERRPSGIIRRHQIVEDPILLLKKKLEAASFGFNRDWGKMFHKMDTDHSGSLDADEFRLALRRVARVPQKQMSDDDIHTLFLAIDSNNDGNGTIELSEFADFMNRDIEAAKAAGSAASISTTLHDHSEGIEEHEDEDEDENEDVDDNSKDENGDTFSDNNESIDPSSDVRSDVVIQEVVSEGTTEDEADDNDDDEADKHEVDVVGPEQPVFSSGGAVDTKDARDGPETVFHESRGLLDVQTDTQQTRRPCNKVVFHITGFGKFQGVPDNPTTHLVQVVQQHPQLFEGRQVCCCCCSASCNLLLVRSVHAN